MHTGKMIRMARWLHGGKTFLLAVDQGVPRTVYPEILSGLSVWTDRKSPWDALVCHQGLVKNNEAFFASDDPVPFIIKLTANSRLCPDRSVRGMVADVETACALGASGVALNIMPGSPFEDRHLKQLADTAKACDRFGMPLIVFATPHAKAMEFDADAISYCCMIAAEMGADVVKTDYPGSVEGMRKISEACMCPVLVEESPYSYDADGTLRTTREAMEGGAGGVLFGGRVWQEKEALSVGTGIRDIVYRKNHYQRA